ncbi:phospholipid-binding protein MlaC [Pelagovum sp. HNIBRBA483]|uniref:MlaC/ttg2D family ABC transporter substrate-binding protein n=1 Tax=Pelagovum sp. HNIBRBA483 TaxID=3233341 RepID=UPI0034A1F822
MSFDYRRREILALAMGALATGAPVGAAAQSAAQARALVDRIVADINAVIASGKSEAAMIRDFEGIFDRYADVPIIARYALGVEARRASADQLRRFTEAFRGYIARRYGRRFREFIGGRVEVQGEREIPRGIQVETLAILQGQSPFRVDFHVSDASGKVLFFNVIIEGIDMLLSERTEMGAMLDARRGDLDALIDAVKEI